MKSSDQGKMLAMAGLPILAGALYLGYVYFVDLPAYDQKAAEVKQEIDKKLEELQKIQKARVQLERWQILSLPTDLHLAQREYYRFLEELLTKSGFSNIDLQRNAHVEVKAGAGTLSKKTLYTSLTYNARAKATLNNLVDMLKKFKEVPLNNKIKSLMLDRSGETPSGGPSFFRTKSKGELLNVNLVFEALIVEGPARQTDHLSSLDNRLLALDMLIGSCSGPTGLVLVPWEIIGPRGPFSRKVLVANVERKYSDIPYSNFFVGTIPPPPPPPPPPQVKEEEEDTIEITKYIFLNEITQSGQEHVGFLFNRLANDDKENRIRLDALPGKNVFFVMDEKGKKAVLRGKVLRINARDVFFSVNEKIYSIHMGQNLAEAMRQSLQQEKIKSLGLSSALNP